MLSRRLMPFALLPIAAPLRGTAAEPPRSGPNCGDPGGRFIACAAVLETLPRDAPARCPLCGGSHRPLLAR